MTATLHKIILLCTAKQAADCKCDQCETLRGIVVLCERELKQQAEMEQNVERLYQIVAEKFLSK